MAPAELPPAALLDTSYLVALANRRDRHHTRAIELERRLGAAATRLVTTRGVLLEFGNEVARRDRRAVGIRMLTFAERDPNLEIVEVTPERYAAGLALFAARPDKDWGLVDCVSFALMAERGLADALTADDHFAQAGFRPLLAG